MNDLIFCEISDIANAEELYRLELLCFPEDPWSLESFISCFAFDITKVFGIKREECLIAYAAVNIISGEAEILNLAVIPSERRQGIGSLLLSGIINYCKENNAPEIYLEAREGNASAIRLYEAHGFTKYNLRKNYYQNPTENAVMMVLR